MKNLKIFFYTVLAIGLFSCSDNDVEDDIGRNPDVENIDLRNFLSTLESWKTNPRSSVNWEHHLDSDGLLLKSVLYEKYPERVIWEIEYQDYNEDQLPIEYQKTYYSFGEVTNFLTWEVSYNENKHVESLTAYDDGSYSHEISFPQLDDEMRVKSAVFLNNSGEFRDREVYEFDDNGNQKTISLFNSQSGNDQDDLIAKWDYTFTHFGDINSYTYEDFENSYTSQYTYSYRENFTLEKVDGISTRSTEGPETISWWEYNQEERPTFGRVTSGDSRWEYISYLPDGRVEMMEYYQQDKLRTVLTNFEDGSTELKKINPEDGSYRIEYIDEEGTVYKVEYYDADDNLLNTENYSATRASQNLKKIKDPLLQDNSNSLKI